MNYSLIVKSLQYISYNYKAIVTLSKDINERIIENNYSDSKLINVIRMNRKDIAISIIQYSTNINYIDFEEHVYEKEWLKIFIDLNNHDLIYSLFTNSCIKNKFESVKFILKNFCFNSLLWIIKLLINDQSYNSIIELLIKYENNKIEILNYACEDNNLEIVKIILDTNIVLNKEIILKAMNNYKLLSTILESEIEIPIEALHLAVDFGRYDIIKLFIDYDLSLINNFLVMNNHLVNNFIINRYL